MLDIKIKKMKYFVLIILQIALLLSSCEKDKNGIEYPIEFEFRILDEKSQPKKEIKQGQNFVFSFLIINKSDSNLLFKPDIVDEKWFNLYDSNSEYIGKAFDSICLGYINILSLNAKDTFNIEIPWIPANDKSYWPFCQKADNANLNTGKYYSDFKSQFTFFTHNRNNYYKSNELTFTTNFNIIE